MQGNDLTVLIIVLVALAAVVLVVWYMMQRRKTHALRDRFGEEYDRTLADVGKRGDTERNLEEREKRVAELEIRPLTHNECDRFAGEWKETKALFVDSPQEALLKGDRLLGEMMQTRGFPMADFDRHCEDLTVNHGPVARHYREGHEVAVRKDATTEEMRRAFKNYEQLFDELVRDAGTGLGDRADNSPATTHSETRRVDTDGDGDADALVTRRTEEPTQRPE